MFSDDWRFYTAHRNIGCVCCFRSLVLFSCWTQRIPDSIALRGKRLSAQIQPKKRIFLLKNNGKFLFKKLHYGGMKQNMWQKLLKVNIRLKLRMFVSAKDVFFVITAVLYIYVNTLRLNRPTLIIIKTNWFIVIIFGISQINDNSIK